MNPLRLALQLVAYYFTDFSYFVYGFLNNLSTKNCQFDIKKSVAIETTLKVLHLMIIHFNL